MNIEREVKILLAFVLIGLGHVAVTIHNGLADVADVIKWSAIKAVNGAAILTGQQKYQVQGKETKQ